MKKYMTPELELTFFNQDEIIMISGIDSLQDSLGEVEAEELGLDQ